ncbi:hypothetical protein [Burkholderia sp. PU8-34]
MIMRFHISRRAVKGFLLYGLFPDPFSKRYGGGWPGILLGAATRAIPFGVWVGALGCLFTPGAFSAANLLLMTMVFLAFSILLEWDLTRQSGRQEKILGER